MEAGLMFLGEVVLEGAGGVVISAEVSEELGGFDVVGEEEEGLLLIVGVVVCCLVHHAEDGGGGCDAAVSVGVLEGLDVGIFEVEGVVSECVTEGLEFEGFAEEWSFVAFLVVWVVIVGWVIVGWTGVRFRWHPSFEKEGRLMEG